MKQFIRIAHLEGWSFLLLLGIAMPLKYMANIPEVVTYLGWVHGILFIWYLTLIAIHGNEQKWPISLRALAVIAGLLPLGTFIFTRRFRNNPNAQ